MKLSQIQSEIFVPDGVSSEKALARTTHLAIAAHQDDIEILAAPGILECFESETNWFTGVVLTDGRGSPRDGHYKHFTDEEMRMVRIKEQKKAAIVGEYSAVALLDYSSQCIKNSSFAEPVDDIEAILRATKPQIVYTHALADKHDTHIAVCLRVISALRRLSPQERPKHVYGFEVWRDLDWMLDSDKLAFDCSAHENLQAALLGVFDSQIAGGKRYDLATTGRHRAHATYSTSHGTDKSTGLAYGMDLTPLIQNDAQDPATFIQDFVKRFADDIGHRIAKLR
jgi:LmbE family N-acetylglucosaminyl deacetylase